MTAVRLDNPFLKFSKEELAERCAEQASVIEKLSQRAALSSPAPDRLSEDVVRKIIVSLRQEEDDPERPAHSERKAGWHAAVDRFEEDLDEIIDRLSPQPEAEPVAWRNMESAPRDGSPAILRWANNGSGLQVCAILHYDKHNPKGNPWRMPMCDAWFGEALFDAWMPAPPVYTSPRLDREKVAATFKAAFDRAYMDAADEETAQDLAIEAGIDAIMRETR